VGAGWRPAGTGIFTIGVDGVFAQSGNPGLRAGARVEIPSFGAIRGEAYVEPGTLTWRAVLGPKSVWPCACGCGRLRR